MVDMAGHRRSTVGAYPIDDHITDADCANRHLLGRRSFGCA